MNIISKYKDMPVQAKASLWYTICNILQKGISFFVVPIYTRLLTTAEYGYYSVFQSWRDILLIFATLNLYCGVFTKAMVDYEDDRKRYTSCMQGLSTVITAVLLLFFYIAHDFWSGVLGMNQVTIILMFVYFVFYPAYSFWSVKQKVEYQYVKMVAVTLAVSILTPLVSIILLYSTALRENAVIWGYLIVQICVGGYFYIYNFIEGKTFFIKKYWKHALKFNIPLIPHYLSLIVLGQADRIMIEHYCGAEKAGIYNLAYQVSMVMNVIIGAINGSLVPWTYEQLKIKNDRAIQEIVKKLCILVLVMTVGVVLVAPEVILILGTHDYYEAIWVVPSVAISVYFTFCYGQFSTVEFYYSATKYVMVASISGSILNVILNAIFIPYCGFVAAGYTTATCYLVFMIMHYCFMKKVCREQERDYRIFDTKFMAVSSIGLCCVAMACMLLYEHILMRYGLLLVIGILILIKRKYIFALIKNMK